MSNNHLKQFITSAQGSSANESKQPQYQDRHPQHSVKLIFGNKHTVAVSRNSPLLRKINISQLKQKKNDIKIRIPEDLGIQIENLTIDAIKKSFKILNGELLIPTITSFEEMSSILRIFEGLQVSFDDHSELDAAEKYFQKQVANIVVNLSHTPLFLKLVQAIQVVLASETCINIQTQKAIQRYIDSNLLNFKEDALQDKWFHSKLVNYLKNTDLLETSNRSKLITDLDGLNIECIQSVIKMVQESLRYQDPNSTKQNGSESSNQQLLKQVLWTIKMGNLDQKLSKPFLIQLRQDENKISREDILAQIKVARDEQFDRYNIFLQEVNQDQNFVEIMQNQQNLQVRQREPYEEINFKNRQNQYDRNQQNRRRLHQSKSQNMRIDNKQRRSSQSPTYDLQRNSSHNRHTLAFESRKNEALRRIQTRYSKIKVGTKKSHFINREINKDLADNYHRKCYQSSNSKRTLHRRSKTVFKGTTLPFQWIQKSGNQTKKHQKTTILGLSRSHSQSYFSHASRFISKRPTTEQQDTKVSFQNRNWKREKTQENVRRSNISSMFSMKNMIINYNNIVQQKKHNLLQNNLSMKMRSRSLGSLKPATMGGHGGRSGLMMMQKSAGGEYAQKRYLSQYKSQRDFNMRSNSTSLFPINQRFKQRSASQFLNYQTKNKIVTKNQSKSKLMNQQNRPNSENLQIQFRNNCRNNQQINIQHEKRLYKNNCQEKRHNSCTSIKGIHATNLEQKIEQNKIKLSNNYGSESQYPLIQNNQQYQIMNWNPYASNNQSRRVSILEGGTQNPYRLNNSPKKVNALERIISLPEIIQGQPPPASDKKEVAEEKDIRSRELSHQSTIESRTKIDQDDQRKSIEPLQIIFTNLEVEMKFQGPYQPSQKAEEPTSSKNSIEIIQTDDKENKRPFDRLLGVVLNMKMNPQFDIDLRFYRHTNAKYLQSNLHILRIIKTYHDSKQSKCLFTPAYIDEQNALQLIKIIDNRSKFNPDLEKVSDTFKFCTICGIKISIDQFVEIHNNSVAQQFIDQINWKNVNSKCLENILVNIEHVHSNQGKCKEIDSLIYHSSLLKMIINEQIIERDMHGNLQRRH